MKTQSKTRKVSWIGIAAFIAVIGLLTAACGGKDKPDSRDGGALTIGAWSAEDTLAADNSEVWYTFNVTNGSTYYVFVKDYWSNSVVVADGYADVNTEARFGSKTGTILFEASDSGANNNAENVTSSRPNKASFTATQSGIVYLRVSVDPIGDTGKFRVAVTTSNSRPAGEDVPTLILGSWSEGTLASASSEAWYAFPVTSGTAYYVSVKDYWSDSVESSDTSWGGVLTTARYGSKTGTVIFQDSDAGADISGLGTTNLNFTASQAGTVYLRVHPETGILATYGKFKVAVTTTSSRPSGE